jgi:hypothetical protein
VADAIEDDEKGRPQDAPGVLRARFMVQRFARGEDGARSAIRKGLRKFWARARGATADLEVDGNMQTRIDVDGPIEELYLLDPEAEEPLEYEPESHEFGLPDLLEYDEEGNLVAVHPTPYLLGGGWLGLTALAGDVLANSWPLGLFVGGFALLVTKVARPSAGRFYADLAPVHYHHAVGAMLTHATELGDAKAWQEWFLNYTESEAENAAEKKDLADDRSTTQLEQLFSRYVGEDDTDTPTRSSAGGEASGDD